MKLKDKVALVTGAGSGIGRAIAQLFAEEGARVIANDVREEAAKETVAAISSGGCAIQADVADSAQVRAMFAQIEREFGTLDVLVNNAGIGTAGSSGASRDRIRERSDARMAEMLSGQGIQTHWDITQEMSDEAWHRMIAVHLNGTFFCTREALKLMSRRNQGAIVARTPLGRWAEPVEVARTALFLASDDSAFFTGQWLSPNGGLFIG